MNFQVDYWHEGGERATRWFDDAEKARSFAAQCARAGLAAYVTPAPADA